MPYVGKEPVRGQNRELDDISGSFNGGNTAFTMQVGGSNTAAASANQVFISLGGVMQNPGTDFTVASSTLTFTTPPANGLDFWGLIQGDAVDIQEPADGSVTSSKIASGNLTLPGDVTIPDKIVHDGDTNTAIRFPAADTITAETGGSERVRVDSSGNVGIGTASPADKFHVVAGSQRNFVVRTTGGVPLLYAQNDSGNVEDLTIGGNNVIFKAGSGSTGSEVARISENGGITFNGDTAAANGLDDYEEGTWTPRMVYYNAGSGGWNNACTFSDDPETTNAGTYTRIGRVVYFSYYSSLFNVTNGVGESAGIDGLPFANAGKYHVFSTAHTSAFQTSSVNGYVNINDDLIIFNKIDSYNGATWHTNNSYLMVSGFYFVS